MRSLRGGTTRAQSLLSDAAVKFTRRATLHAVIHDPGPIEHEGQAWCDGFFLSLVEGTFCSLRFGFK